jgi:DNA-binding transcriptional LysR family regulator
MTTNLSSASYWAVANGAGIGVFPSYACTFGGKIIPLEIEWRRPFDIWLSYHPGCGRIPWLQHVIDWLIEAFNPENSRGLRTNSSIHVNLNRYIRVNP